jgi:NTE family protein
MAIRNLFEGRRRNRQPVETAFVIGGGGNLGAIHVGQLKALLERGITPDVVIGCSVGALNGAAIAGDPTLESVERLTEVWKSLAREDIFSSRSLGRGPWMFVRNGLSAFNDMGLRKLIDRLSFGRFEDAKVPFWVNATSLRTGLERWFHTGDVKLPLLASTALPGVFPPVEIDGDIYIDGGVVDNVPISKAFELNAKRVYVLDVGNFDRERPDPRRPYEVLLRAVGIARTHRFRIEQNLVPDAVEMTRLPGVDPGKLRYNDFRRSAELIEKAYEASAVVLEHQANDKPA